MNATSRATLFVLALVLAGLFGLQGSILTATATPPPRVAVCHVPKGDPLNVREVDMPASLVPVALAHGDFIKSFDCSAHLLVPNVPERYRATVDPVSDRLLVASASHPFRRANPFDYFFIEFFPSCSCLVFQSVGNRRYVRDGPDTGFGGAEAIRELFADGSDVGAATQWLVFATAGEPVQGFFLEPGSVGLNVRALRLGPWPEDPVTHTLPSIQTAIVDIDSFVSDPRNLFSIPPWVAER